MVTEASDKGLHDEIIAAQKARAKIWSWKLILVSGLAAAGLGISLGASPTTGAPLVLCCIPIVCAYTDFLWNHLVIRCRLIGAWRRTRPGSDDLIEYERFSERLGKKGVGNLERRAIRWSSFAANLSLIVVGVGRVLGKGGLHAASIRNSWEYVAVASAGVLGIIATVWVMIAAKRQRDDIDEAAKSAATTVSLPFTFGEAPSGISVQRGMEFSESPFTVRIEVRQKCPEWEASVPGYEEIVCTGKNEEEAKRELLKAIKVFVQKRIQSLATAPARTPSNGRSTSTGQR